MVNNNKKKEVQINTVAWINCFTIATISRKNVSYLDNLFSLNFIQKSFIPGINREQLRLAHNRVFQF